MNTPPPDTNENIQSDRGDSNTSIDLDENLWSSLQHHIDLAESVYSKLPFEEFFQLRRVCKDWYVIACKRLGLKEPIHKPFFTLFTRSRGRRLNGILFYNALSRSWDWRPNFFQNSFGAFFASEGIVLSLNDDSRHKWGKWVSAFHWQSKTYQRLDPPPTWPDISAYTTVGMIVSKKHGPCSSFKVVLGSQHFGTQVYESGVWQTKPCRIPMPVTGNFVRATTGGVDCNGRVYISRKFAREIFVYDFEKSGWSVLVNPGDWDRNQKIRRHYCPNTLGAWNSRVFSLTCDFGSGPSMENWSLQVWELVDETLSSWKVYDCIPKGLWSWLQSPLGFVPHLCTLTPEISIQASFCGDFMLVYSWDLRNGFSGRFCLFNMATKNWQRLNIAAGTVAVHAQYRSDSFDSFDSSDSDDSDD